MYFPKNMSEFFGVDENDFNPLEHKQIIQSTAHVIIDVQRAYCDPEHEEKRGHRGTEKTATHISTLAPKFRQAGIKTYWVYFHNPDEDKNNPDTCMGGFYKNTPEPEDELIPKNTDSAFEGSDICERLRDAGINRIIVSGFNASSCVKETVIDGLYKNLQICVLKDAIENDNRHFQDTTLDLKDLAIKQMGSQGALIQDSQQVLDVLTPEQEYNKPPSPPTLHI